MRKENISIKGRGTFKNPRNRFETLEYQQEPPETNFPNRGIKTRFYQDHSKSLISYNKSPDIPFDASINPYRGCEHGCAYCYARPTHEYLGLSSGLDFETKIFVKQSAPDLLKKELSSHRWSPKLLALSGVTDPYQPIERKALLTRKCLEVIAQFKNPVVVITKNHGVTRDKDLLGVLAQDQAAAVFISITTLETGLWQKLEPRTSSPQLRLEAIRELVAAGVPTGVMVAPVIPALNDFEISGILEAAHSAGASFASFLMIRLPLSVAPLFETWLDRHYPDRKKKILNRIREMKGGKLNRSEFGKRMRGEGIHAEQIEKIFGLTCQKLGLKRRAPELSTQAFRNPSEKQISLSF